MQTSVYEVIRVSPDRLQNTNRSWLQNASDDQQLTSNQTELQQNRLQKRSNTESDIQLTFDAFPGLRRQTPPDATWRSADVRPAGAEPGLVFSPSVERSVKADAQ